MNTCTKTIDITKPHTTRDGRPVRDLVRYIGMAGGECIGGLVSVADGREYWCEWFNDGRRVRSQETSEDLIHAPEIVEVMVYYYRHHSGEMWVSLKSDEYHESCLFAKRVERVTVGEGLEGKT